MTDPAPEWTDQARRDFLEWIGAMDDLAAARMLQLLTTDTVWLSAIRTDLIYALSRRHRYKALGELLGVGPDAINKAVTAYGRRIRANTPPPADGGDVDDP